MYSISIARKPNPKDPKAPVRSPPQNDPLRRHARADPAMLCDTTRSLRWPAVPRLWLCRVFQQAGRDQSVKDAAGAPLPPWTEHAFSVRLMPLLHPLHVLHILLRTSRWTATHGRSSRPTGHRQCPRRCRRPRRRWRPTKPSWLCATCRSKPMPRSCASSSGTFQGRHGRSPPAATIY